MRYRLRVKVSSIGVLESTEVTTDSYLLRVLPGASGTVERLEAETTVPDYQACLSPLVPNGSPSPGHAPFSIIVNTDHKYHEYLLNVLRYYTTVGAFCLNILDVDWNSLELKWIPESDAEKKHLSASLLGFGGMRVSYSGRLEVNLEVFKKTVALEADRDHLKRPMDFYREGVRLYHQLRYIMSFVYFFYCLEYQFGNGKYKTKPLMDAFRKEDCLLRAADIVWVEMLKVSNLRHLERIKKYLAEAGEPPNAFGILGLLPKMRGRLHHANSTPESLLKPFDESEYDSLAFVTMALCAYSFSAVFDAAWSKVKAP